MILGRGDCGGRGLNYWPNQTKNDIPGRTSNFVSFQGSVNFCNHQHIFFYNIAAKLKKNKNKKAKNTSKNNVYNFMIDIIVAIKMWSRCCKLLIDSIGLYNVYFALKNNKMHTIKKSEKLQKTQRQI